MMDSVPYAFMIFMFMLLVVIRHTPPFFFP